MKKYIQPTIEIEYCVLSTHILENSITNEVGDEEDASNQGLFDEQTGNSFNTKGIWDD